MASIAASTVIPKFLEMATPQIIRSKVFGIIKRAKLLITILSLGFKKWD